MPSKIKRSRLKDREEDRGRGVRESAGQIWLAGVGAFSLAQKEGGKVFDALVAEGRKLESRTRKSAQGQADTLKASAKEAQAKAASNIDRLEEIFQDRVSRSLKALGVPTQEELEHLMNRVDELRKSVDELKKKQA